MWVAKLVSFFCASKITPLLGRKMNKVFLLLSMHDDYWKINLNGYINSNRLVKKERKKISSNGDYLLSSNPKTSIKVSKNDTPSRIPCPIRQKAAKGKIKGKRDATSSPIVDLLGMEATIRGKNVVNKRITKAKEAENVVVLYKILMKDTSIMFEEQRKKYEITCSYILYNFSN